LFLLDDVLDEKVVKQLICVVNTQLREEISGGKIFESKDVQHTNAAGAFGAAPKREHIDMHAQRVAHRRTLHWRERLGGRGYRPATDCTEA